MLRFHTEMLFAFNFPSNFIKSMATLCFLCTLCSREGEKSHTSPPSPPFLARVFIKLFLSKTSKIFFCLKCDFTQRSYFAEIFPKTFLDPANALCAQFT